MSHRLLQRGPVCSYFPLTEAARNHVEAVEQQGVSAASCEQVYIYGGETRALTSPPRPAPKAPQHEYRQCAVLPQPAAGCCCQPGTETLR